MKSDKPAAWYRRAHLRQVVILTALLTLFGTGLPKLRAGADKWTSIGPFGGWIQSLEIDPQNPETIYAGTDSGIFKSTDGGSSWNSINSMIAVVSLAIDPQTPSTLYAGSYGVFKSVDGGTNWSAASFGLPRLSDRFGPQSDRPNLQDGPYWDVRALAIDPQNPETLYAVTGRGLFKSVDGAASWNAVGGLPTIPIGIGYSINLVYRLAIDPQNPGTVYASANFPNGNVCCSSGLFKTTDGGATWSALTLPAGRSLSSFSISALVIDPQKPNTVYAVQGGPSGLFKSTDGGASWSTVSSTFVAYTMAIDPQTSNTLYASTFNGVLKSTDGGTIWTAVSPGMPGGVGPLVIDPRHPTIVYKAAGIDGLFKTTNGGANWNTANSGLSTLSVTILAIDPRNSGSIYAGTGWMGVVLAKSTDAGSNWIPLNSALPNFFPFTFAIDPQNPKILYAGTNAGDFGPAAGIFKSTDGGNTWAAAMSGLPGNLYGVNALAIDPKNPNTMYAGTDQGLFKSTDAAASWNAANLGLPAYISTLAIDPRTPTTVYAAGSGGVFKSTNSGGEWNTAGFPKDFATVLAIDPQNSRTVYAGSAGRLFKSTDAGTSWTGAGSGLPSNENWMTALVIDPRNSNTLYLATSGAGFDGCSIPCSGLDDGVFKSTDGGTTWSAVNTGLTTPHVSSLAVDPHDSSRLYAATMGGGVFEITFGPAPVVTGFRLDRTSVAIGGSFSVIVSGPNLTPQTFFDVRFTSPGSNASDVVLNWQSGLEASHRVSAGAAAGIWTINGVRAHQIETDHTGSFVPINATITVSP